MTKTTERADTAWKKASFYLPQAANLPVEVELADGKREIRKKVEGDWREVRSWRSI